MTHAALEEYAPVPPCTCSVEPALAQALAAELVSLTGLLADLARDLASSPETLRRHMDKLQLIDLITQTQLAIAGVLDGQGGSAQRLAGVTLEGLAKRLGEAIPRG